jgi:uncharacterized protein (TIGR02265 family)
VSSKTTVPGKLVTAVFGTVLKDDLTTELKGSLAQAGLDVAAPAADAVPREVWDRALEVTAQALFPGGADGLRKLGRHIVTVLPGRGLVKGPWLSVAKLMGVRRALKQGAQLGGSSSQSPVTFKVIDRGSREVEVHVDEGRQSELLAGLLEGCVTILGGRDVHVLVASAQPSQSVLIASWR